MLKDLKEKQFQNRQKTAEIWLNTDNYVFTDKQGKLITQKALYNAFKRLIAKIPGLPDDLTVHGLRRSYATLSIENGTDIATVSEILGHSQKSTTLNIYSHSSDSMKRTNADRMESLLKTASHVMNFLARICIFSIL